MSASFQPTPRANLFTKSLPRPYETQTTHVPQKFRCPELLFALRSEDVLTWHPAILSYTPRVADGRGGVEAPPDPERLCAHWEGA